MLIGVDAIARRRSFFLASKGNLLLQHTRLCIGGWWNFLPICTDTQTNYSHYGSLLSIKKMSSNSLFNGLAKPSRWPNPASNWPNLASHNRWPTVGPMPSPSPSSGFLGELPDPVPSPPPLAASGTAASIPDRIRRGRPQPSHHHRRSSPLPTPPHLKNKK